MRKTRICLVACAALLAGFLLGQLTSAYSAGNLCSATAPWDSHLKAYMRWEVPYCMTVSVEHSEGMVFKSADFNGNSVVLHLN